MRKFHWPNWISTPLMVGSLALSGAAAVHAADAASSSVNFVDRDALTAAGWAGSTGNPLRTGTSTSVRHDAGNNLRSGDAAAGESDAAATPRSDGNVTPASYNASVPRGFPLRPHTTQTGIFSGMLGEGTQSRARTASGASNAQHGVLPPATAAKRAMSLMPQFLSSSGKKRAQAAQSAAARSPSTLPMPTAARTGSANQFAARSAAGQPAGRPIQSSYNTAASAQSYRHAEMSGSAASAYRRPTLSTHGIRTNAAATAAPSSRASASNKSRLAAPSANDGSAASSGSAQVLAEAHQLAESARTEADFSQIFSLCQQVPASQATAEEAKFGRQLAAWALNRRGQLRARAGNTEDALADFDMAIRVDPQRWRALHNRGVLLAQAGQFEPAFDDFHHTIELNPQFAKAYSNRAALYVLAGEVEPALRDYERAIELDPNLEVAHRGCGRTCHLLGRVDEALTHLTTAIELAPQDAAALASRGDLLTDLGDYAAAADDYERALAANAKSADACRGSAWLLATCPDDAIRNPDLALKRAQLAARLDRKADAVTLDTLAAAQAGVGDFEAAAQTIRRAIELAPPSERSVYQDRLQMYRKSTPYRIAPLEGVRQAGYER